MQGVGWRRSRACGSAPQLGHMRPLAICSLGFYLTTLPGWTVARSRQQWKRLPGTPRRMAAQSRAFASDSHASTTSLRRAPRSASQTQSTGACPNGLLKFASPSNGRYLKGGRPRPRRRPLASRGWIWWINEACLCRPAGGRRLQTCWTVAHRATARPREPVEHVALCIVSMRCPAQVHLQTMGVCNGQERKQQESTAKRWLVARRPPQRAQRCDTARYAMLPCAAFLLVSQAINTTTRCHPRTAWLIRSSGRIYPTGMLRF